MSIIAAFLWKKSPHCSICTMLLDEDTMQFIVRPTIKYIPKQKSQFKKAARAVIKEFFAAIEHVYRRNKAQIILEFRIIFKGTNYYYITPAEESLFVEKQFKFYLKKTKKIIKKNLKIKPQLRQRLSGKILKLFKKRMNSLHLVSRKKHTNYEYHLWTVALHATPKTYSEKLRKVKAKLVNAIWDAA